jgi:hypothetical protein
MSWILRPSGLLCDVWWFEAIVSSVLFGRIFRDSDSWTASPLKMGPMSPETSVSNNRIPRNNPKDARIKSNRSGSLWSHVSCCPLRVTEREVRIYNFSWSYHQKDCLLPQNLKLAGTHRKETSTLQRASYGESWGKCGHYCLRFLESEVDITSAKERTQAMPEKDISSAKERTQAVPKK